MYMRNKHLIWISTVLGLFFIILATYFSIQPYLQGIRPAWLGRSKTADTILLQLQKDLNDPSSHETGPLIVHPDYSLSILSSDIISPRVMVEDKSGNILVSEPSEERVSLITTNGKQMTLLDGLNKPHGLALTDQKIYIAETGQVLEYDYNGEVATNPQVLLDLPADGRHWTRTLGIGPDNALYISVGSSCNICEEEDWRRTKILRYDILSQELTVYASGLRNSVFFAWNDLNQLFATEMGRDWLGDDLPPDEINLIQRDKDYGFPYCYGLNSVDPEFNNDEHCQSAEGAYYEFAAHESPLGIDFLDGDIIVALHGSWNRKEPVGYEVIRLSAESDYQEREVLLSGFLLEDGSSFGRPAGILVTNDHRILISDDKADLIYELKHR